MTSAYIDLPTFDIRHFEDRLTLAEGHKDRYLCPACNGNNLTFSRITGAYTCWNDESDRHRIEIKEAICPLQEAIETAREKQGGSIPSVTKGKAFKPHIKAAPKPAPLPAAGITLAKLAAPAIDAPQPSKQLDHKHGEVQEWLFYFSETQWIRRIQWEDASRSKGYDKQCRPWHIDTEGKPTCEKGDAPWKAYREDEAIEAAQSSGANAILLVEGEPCVECVRGLGVAAITMPGIGWSQAEIAAMVDRLKVAGLAIVMQPDHDKSGYDKADKVAAACTKAGVPYLQLAPLALDPDAAAKDDVIDMVKRMGSEEFIKRLEAEIHRTAQARSNSAVDRPKRQRPAALTARADPRRNCGGDCRGLPRSACLER